MKIIFMGTPDFAVGTFQALLGAGHQIVLAVTQPDKPKGRHGSMAPSPVKEAALAEEIPVYQPEKIRDPESLTEMQAFQSQAQADLIVVVAFGQILPKEILTLCPRGCINVHASLLPSWRGAAPIQWAILSGDSLTGVTTMQMDEGLDTGDILLQQEVPISPTETGGSLSDKLSAAGAGLCIRTLRELEAGTLSPRKQGESPTPYASMIKKSMGRIDWTKPAVDIDRQIRGLNPWPSAYTRWEDLDMKIWEAAVEASDSGKLPGTVTAVTREAFFVQTGRGQLKVLSLQLPGKKRMDTGAFLRGNDLAAGTRFTSP